VINRVFIQEHFIGNNEFVSREGVIAFFHMLDYSKPVSAFASGYLVGKADDLVKKLLSPISA